MKLVELLDVVPESSYLMLKGMSVRPHQERSFLLPYMRLNVEKVEPIVYEGKPTLLIVMEDRAFGGKTL